MEAVFLETSLSSNFLINCVTGDMSGYRAMERGIKVCDRFGAWQSEDTSLDDRECCTVMPCKEGNISEEQNARKEALNTEGPGQTASLCAHKILR